MCVCECVYAEMCLCALHRPERIARRIFLSAQPLCRSRAAVRVCAFAGMRAGIECEREHVLAFLPMHSVGLFNSLLLRLLRGLTAIVGCLKNPGLVERNLGLFTS